jgi:hypothetical protein
MAISQRLITAFKTARTILADANPPASHAEALSVYRAALRGDTVLFRCTMSQERSGVGIRMDSSDWTEVELSSWFEPTGLGRAG